MSNKTFKDTVIAYDLEQQILNLRDENGGQLLIIFYVNIGPDGSSGHHFYKKVTDSSLLTGRACITNFNPIQFVTEIQLKAKVLYSNVLACSSDSVRPLRIVMKPEDEIVEEEIARLHAEVDNLQPFQFAPGVLVKTEAIFGLGMVHNYVDKVYVVKRGENSK